MNQPKIIAIETSSRLGSVALAEGPNLLEERTFATQTEHGRELLPTLDAMCRARGWRAADVSQCYLSIGPGSFTGLRVGVTFARAAALAGKLQIVAVPTLAVIAENCAALSLPPSPLAVILDAKRQQVFGGVLEWSADGYQCVIDAALTAPAELLSASPQPVAVTGEGISYHREAVLAAGIRVIEESLWQPRATMVHRIGWRMAQRGEFTAARSLIPLYIRRPEAEELWEKRQAGK
ncbi:MAG TPA: tRNA (adenosine(37)-N6)-threonylcarbamoyltransferase complex dimerization subunit type 1 TsaB [Phycisphaerae bacterium]|nr:tRNA (adenosine(37)-N6)-threonylcarbamoyltransferase complex dimerization subunit type 1 TsaB [Phycisphaerae bacterium]